MKFPQRGNHKHVGKVATYVAVVQHSNWELCRVNCCASYRWRHVWLSK